jgi:Nif-specific regulatory protein
MPSADHLMAIAEFGRDLASGTSARSGLQHAMRVLDRRLGARRCLALWSDPKARELELLACHGLASERFRPRYGTGVAGRVAESGRPIVVPSVRHEAMALSELSEPDDWIDGRWSQIAVPLLNEGERVGVLSAYFPDGEGSDFTGRLGLLGVVAALIAQAFTSPHTPLSEAGPPERSGSTGKSSEESRFE